MNFSHSKFVLAPKVCGVLARMEIMMKRVVTIQDISCIGKCSLTVALPIISSMGVETCIIPTAVLSTHTAFEGFTFRDLTEDIPGILKHWEKEHMEFDAIYTGYMGSIEQMTIVSEMFKHYQSKGATIIVDPVMADNGKLYPGFTKEFASAMTRLCQQADVIMPNMTEASFMLDIPYEENISDEHKIRDILRKLGDLGTKKVILTGVSLKPDKIGAYSYDRESGEFFDYEREHIAASYHGTGDVFASAFTGAIVNGLSFADSLRCAVDFTVECIRQTESDPDSRWYGVNFEAAIPYLSRKIFTKKVPDSKI